MFADGCTYKKHVTDAARRFHVGSVMCMSNDNKLLSYWSGHRWQIVNGPEIYGLAANKG